ncbi:Oxidoreductase FAD-binding domain protein [Catenulispora acidiphila DSM 44928]|uniref:nitric oxide dioxygenase n=1 Tax=Catenulispora acidiphila (strain DSM 44928 / JCM 14897 / NBRC 102108 / NRRL B-24433 / ID139908) TaxID=479433 RepID=C7PVF6_CATAD|nr:globin domain-containing protein [Catenulispora acidiphila]ACU69312.1 Oxidoreductase FAD-binding domain protein [Catenulispora acidiphila DSM 44928]
MLSEQSAATVRATLPVVGAAIGDITERFYARLFQAHPELLRDLFNRGNQAAGTQRLALAGSIAAFATQLVEQPGTRPDALLSRIAHKHASLGVSPAQYKVVHQHLFAAIAEVLGDAVTPDVAAAWDEVYWLMAHALIAIEGRLSTERGYLVGGTWRDWEVVGRREETADVASFLLRPVGGGTPQPFQAGQYVSVQVELPDGARQIRQYSLTSAPDAAVRQIGVKRERGTDADPAGEVSNHLHDTVQPGHVLRISAPFGDLVVDAGASEQPLLLASAGIGVTPMISILAELVNREHAAPVLVVHADRSPEAHALRSDQNILAAKLISGRTYYWYENDAGESGRVGLADLSDVEIPAGTAAFLCGPLPFMRAMREQLLAKGVPAADIHYEVFGPDLWLAA